MVSAPYPNPATDRVTIEVYPARPGEVRWTVFTTAFRKIREGALVSGGEKVRVVWDLRDAAGSPAANGMYFVRVEIDRGWFILQKVILLR